MAFHQDLIKLPARAPARPVGNGLEEGDQKVVVRVITWDYEKKTMADDFSNGYRLGAEME